MRQLSVALLVVSLGVACSDAREEDGAAAAGGSAGSAGSDAGGDAAPPFLPFMPTAPASPYVDTPFVQEQNHTSNEVEPGIGALVSVVVAPAAFSGFDLPTQVTARGLVRHAAGAPMVVAIDAAEPDLVAAAASGDALVLAGPSALFVVAADGSLARKPAPAGVTVTGLAAGAHDVYLLTDAGLGRLAPGGEPEWPAAGGSAVTAAVETASRLIVGDAGFVAAFALPLVWPPVVRQWQLPTGPVAALVGAVTLPEALDVVVVGQGSEGVKGIVVDAGGTPRMQTVASFAADRVPLWNARAAARASDGGFVVATDAGAYRVMERGQGPEWRVYGQERWLPSEDVRALATDPTVADGPVWFATAGGLATVTAKRVTLEEKLAPFVERVVQRHDRDGAVADSHLTRKGDLASNVPWDSDNDGSWTSYWLLAECFRWKVTQAPDAKAHFDRSLEAMLRLRDVTGTKFFVARSVIRKEGCLLDDCAQPDDGLWFTSPDGKWWVKDDTSNDEVVAHTFMMGHAYDLCADDAQKAAIADHVAGIVGGIMDHGWQLLRHDESRVTTYGQFDPAYVNGIAGIAADGGVRAAEILAGLTLAHHMTGEARFLDGKRALIEQHQYDVAVETLWDHPLHQGNDDGNEMGTEAYFTLLRYEPDPALRAQWASGWRKTWKGALERQQGAWWTLVDAVVGEPDADLGVAARWLRLAPADMIRWDMHNAQRHDLVAAPSPSKDGSVRSDGRILPYDERRCDRWNTDQFRVDGGMGATVEMDGADVLAPYWMGRYYGLIAPAN